MELEMLKRAGFQQIGDMVYLTNSEVIKGKITFNEKVFMLFLARKKESGKGFLMSSVVTEDNKVLWNIRDEYASGIKLRAHLVVIEKTKEPVIALVKIAGNTLFSVIPLVNLDTRMPVMKEGQSSYIVIRETGEMIQLKKQAAKQLKFRWELTDDEKSYELNLLKVKESLLEERKLARKEERGLRLESIMQREKVTGFTADGQVRFGFPVVGEEWQCLKDGTAAVQIEAIKDGKPVGEKGLFFYVNKRPGGVCKKGEIEVNFNRLAVNNQKEEKAAQLKCSKFFLLEGETQPRNLFVFEESSFDILKERGHNSGSVIAFEKNDGTYVVRRFTGKQINDVRARAL